MDIVPITLSRLGLVWLFSTRSYFHCHLRDNRTTPLGAIEPNEWLRKMVIEIFSVYDVLRIVCWEEVLQRPVAMVKYGELARTQAAAPTSVQFAVSERANFNLTKLVYEEWIGVERMVGIGDHCAYYYHSATWVKWRDEQEL